MGPLTKRTLQERWDADSRSQRFCLEELRSQRSVQLAILAEIRKMSALLETNLGQYHSDMETLRVDLGVIQRQTQEHERKLAAR